MVAPAARTRWAQSAPTVMPSRAEGWSHCSAVAGSAMSSADLVTASTTRARTRAESIDGSVAGVMV